MRKRVLASATAPWFAITHYIRSTALSVTVTGLHQ